MIPITTLNPRKNWDENIAKTQPAIKQPIKNEQHRNIKLNLMESTEIVHKKKDQSFLKQCLFFTRFATKT